MTVGRFVSYLRVSTKRQGESGLGLEAQRKAIRDFLNGGPWELVQEFVEVESGKRQDNRPKLDAAIKLAKVTGAKLLIARLDRLSRNAAFLMGLADAGIDFVCCDMPNANRMTVGIMALVAQDERERISSRTKAALVAAKARGVRLGCPNGAAHLRGRGNAEAVDGVRRKADKRAEALRGTLLPLLGRSLQQIADALNGRGILTARGGPWHPSTVKRVLDRLGLERSSTVW